MKIIVTGGSGFLGWPLCVTLVSRGHEVVALTRGPSRVTAVVRLVSWKPDHGAAGSEWAAEIDGADAVINLSGEGIADRRWTAARKGRLRESRLSSTRALVEAIRTAKRPPSVFVSGSAIGYYGGSEGDHRLDESSPAGGDFLARLCVEWEAEARKAEAPGCRVVLVRTGIALAREGGALKKLLPPFQWFAGGPIGSGRQYMSWIHRDDWVRMVEWTLTQRAVAGPINATAPSPVANADFSTALGRALHRPSWLRVPLLPLRMLLGEMADVALVNGQRVMPARALDSGFSFKYEDIHEALKATVGT